MSSPGIHQLDDGHPIKAKFPKEHITAMGAGDIGQVYVHFGPDGTIIKAEADLIGGTFKHIIIDDPKILRIFGKNGDTIDVKVLHPAAMFWIRPLKFINSDEEYPDDLWHVGRLIDITNSNRREAYRIEATLGEPVEAEEGAVHKRIRESLEAQRIEKAGKGAGRKRATEDARDPNAIPLSTKRFRATETSVDIPEESMPARDTSEESDVMQQEIRHTQVTPRKRAPRERAPRKRAPKKSKTPELDEDGPPKLTKPQIATQALQRVLDVLPTAHRDTYNHFATVVRKEVAKNEEKTLEFHRQLRRFVDEHNILELHNEYAKLLKASGPNKAFQMPFFVDEDGS